MLTCSASRVSALPLLLDTPRFPCLATASPAPHNTKEEVVEILKVFRQSPPVPTISTIPFTSVGSGVALLTMTLDAAAISAGLSFFIFIAIRNALTCSLLALPSIMIFMAVFISSVVRSWCSLTFLIYSFNIHSSSLSL